MLASQSHEGTTYDWIKESLVGRFMRVVVSREAAAWTEVESDVSQGSVLGPLLFLLSVNDVPSLRNGNLKLFADYMKIWREI
jgi:ribonucleases P/MRP protein subunit RPP40